MDKTCTPTIVPRGSFAPYFHEISVISSCSYVSLGLLQLCHGVRCIARPYMIDLFSAYYLSNDTHTMTHEKRVIPHHHYVVHLSTVLESMLAELMTLVVLVNNLPLSSTVTVLTNWPPDFIYHTLRLNLQKRIALAKCRWILAKSPLSDLCSKIPYAGPHAAAVMLERHVDNVEVQSRYVGLTYFEIKMLSGFFSHAHPETRSIEMKSKNFHHHKISGLRKLAQLPGREARAFAGLIHSRKKSLCIP